MTQPAKVLVAILLAAAGLTACRVEHDNPPYQLNAKYHELPPELVDRLLKNPPTGTGIDCKDEVIGGKDVSYCICFGADACRELAAGTHCEAKIGAITHDIGICKGQWVVEKVVVG